MKSRQWFLAAVVFLEICTYVNCSCVFNPGYFSTSYSELGTYQYKNGLECNDFNENFLAFVEEYENVTFVTLNGDFDEIRFDSRYKRISKVQLNSGSLDTFNVSSLENVSSLVDLQIISKNDKVLNLHDDGGGTNRFEKLEILSFDSVTSIVGSVSIFKNLKLLYFYRYKSADFDLSALPMSLLTLNLQSSVPQSNLLNQDSLVRLSNLTRLFLDKTRASLNASFVPSSLRLLYVNDLLEQKVMADTNVSTLQVSAGKDALCLSCMPNTLRDLRLLSTQLDASCQDLQQSTNIKSLYVEGNRNMSMMIDIFRCLPLKLTSLNVRFSPLPLLNVSSLPGTLVSLDFYNSGPTVLFGAASLAALGELKRFSIMYNHLSGFDFSLLPENVTNVSLRYNKIKNIDVKPLLNLNNIELIDLRENPIECTCDFFRDFISVSRKESVWKFYADCAADSLLSGYPFNYYKFGAGSSFKDILRHNYAHVNCSLTAPLTTTPLQVTTAATTTQNPEHKNPFSYFLHFILNFFSLS